MEKDLNQILITLEDKVKKSQELNNEVCLLLKNLTNALSEEKQKFSKKEAIIKSFAVLDSDIINFNVGGKYFSIFKSDVLKKIRISKIGSKSENQFYEPSLLQTLITGASIVKYDENSAIFINRDPKYFNYILNYLRTANTNETFTKPSSLHDLKSLLKESEFYHTDGLTELLNDYLNLNSRSLIKKNSRNRKKTLNSSTSSSNVDSIQKKNKSPLKQLGSTNLKPMTKNMSVNIEGSNASNKNISEIVNSNINPIVPSRFRSIQKISKEIIPHNGAVLAMKVDCQNFLTLNADNKSLASLDEKNENIPPFKVKNLIQNNINKTNDSKEVQSIDALIDLYTVYRDKSKDSYSNNGHFNDSVIINKKLAKELIKLCDFSLNDKWVLIYRGSTHGFGSQDFHKHCDGYAKTITLVKSNMFIFGGYTSASWEETDQYKSDSKSFLFSLVNKDNKPLKMKCQNVNNSIYCSSTSSAVFGGGHDLYISNNSNSNTTSYSNLGHSYEHPKHKYDTSEVSSFLAGCFNFKVNEIEIYYKI